MRVRYEGGPKNGQEGDVADDIIEELVGAVGVLGVAGYSYTPAQRSGETVMVLTRTWSREEWERMHRQLGRG